MQGVKHIKPKMKYDQTLPFAIKPYGAFQSSFSSLFGFSSLHIDCFMCFALVSFCRAVFSDKTLHTVCLSSYSQCTRLAASY